MEEDRERLGVSDSYLDALVDVHDLERKGLTLLIHRLPICLISYCANKLIYYFQYFSSDLNTPNNN